ncbi:MAG: hypothetical protein COB54_04115 [Alphaproteobacteria bacterium]|nr:MAG: hypothetical protein COB54_04115 [Alphaproteobacteria bacterium]
MISQPFKTLISPWLKSVALAVIVSFFIPVGQSPLGLSPLSLAEAAGKDDRKKGGKKDKKAHKKAEKAHKKAQKADKKAQKNLMGKPGRQFEYRNGHKLFIVAPRRRHFKHIVVARPHGHVYWGYGHHYSDNDAWKWLAFTAITLTILDNINEQAQREHEAAQVRATEARVGERIVWNTGEAEGYVVTTREGRNAEGKTCREFQQSVTISGKTEQAYGTACLQPDGAWKISP